MFVCIMIFGSSVISQRISGFKLSLADFTDDPAVFEVPGFNVMKYVKLVHWTFTAHVTNPGLVDLVPVHTLGDLVVQT